MSLRKIFGNDVSSSAFQMIYGELSIVGKYCRLTQDSEFIFDLFICNHADLYSGLGQRKIRNIISRLNLPQESTFHELDGEAWAKVRDINIILQNLPLLGIKKKRRISDERREKLAEQLKKYHAVN